MKKLLSLSLALLAAAAMTVPTLAASHTVQRGDTMWKLAVQYHGGSVEVSSALGKGTCFTVRIPEKA